ncbi:MAG: glycine/sarcosine/betaine reductase selenoprotein B family protein [Candidatus Eremiobacteraeota bacterium]|nr:glycine/sarcosine/betaine reductase selenoprotein B family protein [Candidatus Eremiobacteraeota bacterium]
MTEPSDTAQLRPGLWETIVQRYPGVLVEQREAVPLAKLAVPLRDARICFISSAGVQRKGTLPFDVVHPVGDFSFRRVPSDSSPEDLMIHQLKYPTAGAREDINVAFPLERLQELVAEGEIGALTGDFFSFIGYTIDPLRFEREFAEELAAAAAAEHPDAVLLAPA